MTICSVRLQPPVHTNCISVSLFEGPSHTVLSQTGPTAQQAPSSLRETNNLPSCICWIGNVPLLDVTQSTVDPVQPRQWIQVRVQVTVS